MPSKRLQLLEGFFMHCFQCGEIFEVDLVAFRLLKSGLRCVHSVPMIWCPYGHENLDPSVPRRHTVEWLCSGAWGHTCPHQQSLARWGGRSSKAVAER